MNNEIAIVMVLPPEKEEFTDNLGVPGLFKPQPWDIEDEFKNNDAFREWSKDMID